MDPYLLLPVQKTKHDPLANVLVNMKDDPVIKGCHRK